MANDWFRKTSWSNADQADFFHRLKRARTNRRPQYLRIQAATLYEENKNFELTAISLLDTILAEYPEDIQRAAVLTQKAECLERLDRPNDAIEYYRLAIMQMRKRPSWQTWAWLNLSWLIACRALKASYQEALGLLDEFGTKGIKFPVIIFKIEGIRALIWADLGYVKEASIAARASLMAADAGVSGLSRHPTIGLVGSIPNHIHARLIAIDNETNLSSAL